MSGQVQARQLRLPRQGATLPAEPELPDALLTRLRDEALAAERRLGGSLDLEWGVDAEGACGGCRPAP